MAIILNLILENSINLSFFLVMTFIFIFSFLCLIRKKLSGFVDYTPSLLTSIGIFGTFLGIFFGLLEFDPETIDESIETLLSGLKTAFVTSLIGLILSMVFKTLVTFFEGKTDDDLTTVTQEDITPAHIYEILKSQSTSLKKIETSFQDEQGRSLIGEIAKLREENHKFQTSQTQRYEKFEQALWLKLDEFINILSKSATETIIEALKSVIEDFNQNLTDQFGANFKKLNEAVFKLVDWQDNHLDEMNRLIELHKQNSLSAGHMSKTSEKVVESMQKVFGISKSLEEVLHVNQHQINELNRHLAAFALMREKAVEAVPIIQSKIEEVTSQLANGASQLNQSLTQSANHLTESNKVIAESLMQASQSAKNVHIHFDRRMHEMVDKFSDSVKNVMETFSTSQNEMTDSILDNTDLILNRINDQTKHNVDRTTEAMNVQFMTFEKIMNDVLKELHNTHKSVLESFEGNQNSISDALLIHTLNMQNQVEEQVKKVIEVTLEAINMQIESFDESTKAFINKFESSLEVVLQDIAATQITMGDVLITQTEKVLGHLKDNQSH
ncbi:MotA/TolQ/ExbB proton channel family protein [Thorsellia kenyensis]|uniref:MotA/TolQ/ExbB proton channel family protein n=1 Tax=Thorsellia kenyensis TaxID=1549888 RepID=A0ABV6CD69_9GAMM